MDPVSQFKDLKKNIFISILSGIILYTLAFILHQIKIPTGYIIIFTSIYTICFGMMMTFLCKKTIRNLDKIHQKEIAIIRHDVKGLLSPALLMADRILLNNSADEKIKQSAESIAQSIEKVAEHLKETKK